MENKPSKPIFALSKALDIICAQKHDDNLESYLHTVEDALDDRDLMLKTFDAENYKEWLEKVDASNALYCKLQAILLIILLEEVNIHNFKEYIVFKDWTYEQYVEEETDPNTSGHQFAYKLLSREAFILLKENMTVMFKDE